MYMWLSFNFFNIIFTIFKKNCKSKHDDAVDVFSLYQNDFLQNLGSFNIFVHVSFTTKLLEKNDDNFFCFY